MGGLIAKRGECVRPNVPGDDAHSLRPIEYRRVERFPEPAFASLQREVFSRIDGSPMHCALLSEAAHLPSCIKFDSSLPKVRLGAYDAELLVGWSIGWKIAPDRFCMSNSGVVESYTRRGIYSRLVTEMINVAEAMGCREIVSQHMPGNRAVLAAKEKLGFVRDGTCYSEEFGELMRLRYVIDQRGLV